MFEFKDNSENKNFPNSYYENHNPLDKRLIDFEIYNDIEHITSSNIKKLYRSDFFRIDKKNHIEILSPTIAHQGSRSLMKGPDNIRFLLSLYPDKEDLKNIKRVIIRPRHIEEANVELMGLFLKKSSTLVTYLHYPHKYDTRDAKFNQYNEMLPFNLTHMINKHFYNCADNRDNDFSIPPLLYMLSMISPQHDNEIDKFFVRVSPEPGDRTLTKLDEISNYYYKQGY